MFVLTCIIAVLYIAIVLIFSFKTKEKVDKHFNQFSIGDNATFQNRKVIITDLCKKSKVIGATFVGSNTYVRSDCERFLPIEND